MLAAGLDRLRMLIPFTGGSIAVVERDELVCVAASGPFAAEALGQRQPRSSNSRLWQVVDRSEPFVSGDLQAEGLSPTTPVISYLAVPLVWRGLTFGVLEVDSTEREAFAAADLGLLGRVAAALSGPVQLARRLTDQVEQRRRLQDSLNVLPEGLAIAGLDGRFLLANAAATALLGVDLTRQSIPLMGDREFGLKRLDGTAYPADDVPLARALRDRVAVLGEQVLVRNARDGRTVPLLVNAAPLRDPQGGIFAGVIAFQDITALRDLERSRSDLLSSLSHDLRTPLTAIKGFTQILRRRIEHAAETDQGAADVLSGIEADAKRWSGCWPSCWTSPGSKRARSWSWIAGAWICWHWCGVRSRRGEQHPPSTDRARKSALDELAGEWDEARLERVLANLLSNAIKYSPQGGTVTVRVSREQAPLGARSATVQAARPAPNRWRWLRSPTRVWAFRPPTCRISSSVSTGRESAVGRAEGMGIGLASAKQIVKQHQGTLEVESTPGKGSTFTVRLPSERINRPRRQHADRQQRDQRLRHQQRLGAPGEDERVRRAEGRARVEGEKQVVEEIGHPVLAGMVGVLLKLRKAEVAAAIGAKPAPVRTAAVDLPVPQREREHVAEPDERRVAQQVRAGGLVAG